MKTRRGEWMRLHCGDKVYDVADPRHVGRVMAIAQGYLAKIKWIETGYLSEVPIWNLRRTEEARR